MPGDETKVSILEALRSAKERALEASGYKKGQAFTRRQPDRLAVEEKHEEWGYRWCVDENIQRRESDGWLVVNSMTGVPGQIKTESNGMTGAKTHRELTLMAQPQELVQAHHERVAELTNRQTSGLKEQAASQLKAANPDAEVHGKIVIE